MKKIINIIATVITAIVVVVAVLLIGVRLIGFRPFAVLSPSMTPKYQTGDIVYVKDKPCEEINVGDIITFVVDESGKTATHRVVDLDREERLFRTKGDANDTMDGSPVYYENVVGTVRFSLPKLGYFAGYIATTPGKIVVGCAFVVLVILFLLPEFLSKKTKKEKVVAGTDDKAADVSDAEEKTGENGEGKNTAEAEKKDETKNAENGE